MEMGYLTVLHVRLGAKFGDLHAKDSYSFRNRLINRIRYRFLTVIVLRAWQSIQKRKPPLGFLIKITSIAIGKELTLINPLSRYLSKYFYSTQSLFQDIPHRGLNLGSFPSLIIILQLYSQRSGSLLAFSYKNISRYLQYSTSTFIAGLVYFFSTRAFLISAIYNGTLQEILRQVLLIGQVYRYRIVKQH